MPPAPSRSPISYEPTRVPFASAIGARIMLYALQRIEASRDPSARPQRSGFLPPDRDSDRSDSSGARRARSPRLGDDRQRQNRRVSAADSAQADRPPPGDDARARPDADA